MHVVDVDDAALINTNSSLICEKFTCALEWEVGGKKGFDLMQIRVIKMNFV